MSTDAPARVPAAPNTLDPEFWVDLDAMHATFRDLRAQGPLAWDAASDLWVVVGHAELVEVERRSDVFISGDGYRSFDPGGEDNMISLDDPRHAEQRKLVSRRFTPKAVRELEPYLAPLIDELLGDFVGRGSLEVVHELAAPLPARLTAHLLGFPEEDWPDIKTWSERLMRYDAALTDESALLGFMTAIGEFSPPLFRMFDERVGAPTGDLVSIWANAELGGCPIGRETLVNETGLVISGGAETTRTVIARGLATFAEHPDQWEAMAADPELVPGAVEELIRWVTPLNNFFRVAAVDTTVAGIPVAAGQRLMLAYPSANRDEAVFDDPYRFDITRHPNPHVAFGFGTHFCLGASLARYELNLLFRRLTAAITDLRVLTPPDLEANVFVTAVRSYELGFARR
ncbi:cytochrome P450 [Aquihabitans sp. G128]|uniref:cytochrome P450 n=1 Tax=Aquihabitans sp. G128 TaxID=2849779 RepID=UPI001C23E66E|nr:cytochrome P450 [Aquihabitans sp. G128]QXC59982.1 cytochrome P450 [Aquihabitans sp. G128]